MTNNYHYFYRKYNKNVYPQLKGVADLPICIPHLSLFDRLALKRIKSLLALEGAIVPIPISVNRALSDDLNGELHVLNLCY